MGPKYEFTDETMNYDGHLLHRIRRLSDNMLGGWIEKESNLSQDGDCWVEDDAKVYGDAKIYDNAIVTGKAVVCDFAKVYGNASVYYEAHVTNNAEVYDNARVCGNAWVYENAKIFSNAKVYDDAQVNMNAIICDDAKVFGNAKVYSTAQVYDHADVYGYAQVYGNANVYGNAKIYEGADVCGHSQIFDNAKVYGIAQVFGNAEVYDNAHIYDNAWVYGDAKICGNAIINGTIKISNGKHTGKEDSSKEVIQDFIYKVDDSNKITTQTEYDSIEEFFSEPIKNDVKLDTLVICAVDTKDTLIKLQKVETDDKTEFKFIVDITNEDGEDFIFRSIIKSQEHLNQLIQQTIDMLKQSPQFTKYVDDLENCL